MKTLARMGLATALFIQNCVFANAAESNFWMERRRTHPAAYAGTPPSTSLLAAKNILGQMPSVQAALPALTNGAKIKKEQNNELPPDLKTLTDALPQTACSVQDIYKSPDASHPPVVLIQDIHLNSEAQMNIATVLHDLIKENRIGLIGVEGAFAPFDFRPFQVVQDPKIIKEVGTEFLTKNRMSAPSYVGLNNPAQAGLFVGVDDQNHYTANVEAYLASRDKKAETLDVLKTDENLLIQAKQKTFSPALWDFDKAKQAYAKGTMNLGAYAEKLASYDKEMDFTFQQFVEAYRLERSLNFPKVEQERKIVLENLTKTLSEKEISALIDQSLEYRLGRLGFGAYYQSLKNLCKDHGISLKRTPAFESYIRYVLLSDGVKADKLLKAVSTLEQNVLTDLARSDEDKKLIAESERVSLSQKLAEFSLTPDEWEKYRGLRPAFPLMESFERFYEEADVRSLFMVKNLTANKSGAMVLIVGGFHTPHISSLLREREISHIVVSPKITKADLSTGSAYLSVFSREKTPLDKLVASPKLFVCPNNVHLTDANLGIPLLAALLSRAKQLNPIRIFWKNMPLDVRVPADATLFDKYEISQPWRYRLYQAWRYFAFTVLTQWEVAFVSAVPWLMKVGEHVPYIGVIVVLLSAAVFAISHPNRTASQRFSLFLIGIGLALPLAFFGFGGGPLLVSMGLHAFYNASVVTFQIIAARSNNAALASFIENWLPIASVTGDGSTRINLQETADKVALALIEAIHRDEFFLGSRIITDIQTERFDSQLPYVRRAFEEAVPQALFPAFKFFFNEGTQKDRFKTLLIERLERARKEGLAAWQQQEREAILDALTAEGDKRTFNKPGDLEKIIEQTTKDSTSNVEFSSLKNYEISRIFEEIGKSRGWDSQLRLRMFNNVRTELNARLTAIQTRRAQEKALKEEEAASARARALEEKEAVQARAEREKREKADQEIQERERSRIKAEEGAAQEEERLAPLRTALIPQLAASLAKTSNPLEIMLLLEKRADFSNLPYSLRRFFERPSTGESAQQFYSKTRLAAAQALWELLKDGAIERVTNNLASLVFQGRTSLEKLLGDLRTKDFGSQPAMVFMTVESALNIFNTTDAGIVFERIKADVLPKIEAAYSRKKEDQERGETARKAAQAQTAQAEQTKKAEATAPQQDPPAAGARDNFSAAGAAFAAFLGAFARRAQRQQAQPAANPKQTLTDLVSNEIKQARLDEGAKLRDRWAEGDASAKNKLKELERPDKPVTDAELKRAYIQRGLELRNRWANKDPNAANQLQKLEEAYRAAFPSESIVIDVRPVGGISLILKFLFLLVFGRWVSSETYDRYVAPILENGLTFLLQLILMSQGFDPLTAGAWAWALFVAVHVVEWAFQVILWTQSEPDLEGRYPPFPFPLNAVASATIAATSLLLLSAFPLTALFSLQGLPYLLGATFVHLFINNAGSRIGERRAMTAGAAWLAEMGEALQNRDIDALNRVRPLQIGFLPGPQYDAKQELIDRLPAWAMNPYFQQALANELKRRLAEKVNPNEVDRLVDVLLAVVLAKTSVAPVESAGTQADFHLYLFKAGKQDTRSLRLQRIQAMAILIKTGRMSRNLLVTDTDSVEGINLALAALYEYKILDRSLGGQNRVQIDNALLRNRIDVRRLESNRDYKGASLIVGPTELLRGQTSRRVQTLEALAPISSLMISNMGVLLRKILVAA